MAKLTKEARAKIPTRLFGVPSEREDPMPDKKHAIVAVGLAGMHHDPHTAQIRAKAKKLYPDLKIPSGKKRSE